MILLFLLIVGLYARAAEIEFRQACQLKRRVDEVINLRITSAVDACRGRHCFAGIYRGVQLERHSSDGKTVEIATSAGLVVGQEYLLFAERIRSREIAFDGAGETTYYSVPRSVDYYVPADGAFLHTYRGYSRTVWKWCHGDGPECAIVNKMDKEAFLTAEVLYPNFMHELTSCSKFKSSELGARGEFE